MWPPAGSSSGRRPAIWIAEEDEERAQFAGYTVVDLPTVLATHLTEVLKNHAFEFIGRQETQKLIDSHAKTEPKVVEELLNNFEFDFT